MAFRIPGPKGCIWKIKMKFHTTGEEPPSWLSGDFFPKMTWQQVRKIAFVVAGRLWNSTHRILCYSNTFQISPQQSGEFPFGLQFFNWCVSSITSSMSTSLPPFCWTDNYSRRTSPGGFHPFVFWKGIVRRHDGLKPCRRWRFIQKDPLWSLSREFIPILGKHRSCKSLAPTNKHQIYLMRQVHVLRVKTSGSYEDIQWSRLLFYSECLVCFGDSCSQSTSEHLTS